MPPFNFFSSLPMILSLEIAKRGKLAMQIVGREWDISSMTVLFEVEDGQDKFVCSITENELDRENSHPPMNKTIAEAIFDEEKEEIGTAMVQVIADARARGIKHKAGQKNDPLPVTLPRRTTVA